MSDLVAIKDANNSTVEVLSDEVTDATLGNAPAQKQIVGIADATVGSTNKLIVDSSGRAKVDGSGVTQPVSAAALPLPTGAATAAKQPALGVAGTPSSDVLTVQGIASGRALIVDGSGAVQPINDNGGSLTVDGTVAVSSGPAAARTTDSISAALAIDALMNGLSVLAPNFSGITASASGATTLVAAVASKKIRVHGLFIVCAAAVTLDLQSHTTTATKTGSMPFAANGGMVVSFSPTGWFETVAGEALDINLGGAVAVGGQLIYTTV